ncbi:DUF4249 domain-containing protein [Spirosoma sp. KNUC1025]|uniref:DUF4249 domain-containing protein n=1 Tax=Spirosoma sp. KNUC1025 TaxID=2894082 RepID=UPI003868D198|nr:DUF4249 domain-containing protein [Spirosoma sp. KNUC1025]
MRFIVLFISSLLLLFGITSCVDPADIVINTSVDVLVVDGTITNLAEPQLIRLNHAQSDRLTGRSGTTPITKASVEVLVDSSEVIVCHETEDGTYQLPADFKAQIGHAYQLRFTLSDGMQYVSTQQIMQPVPPIDRVTARFNATSLPFPLESGGDYRAGHDIFVSWQDPANQQNYYRWEWKLWEKQDWCRSCRQGVYAVNTILPHTYQDKTFYVSGENLFEDCFIPTNYLEAAQPPFHSEQYVYDYPCRTQCWEILHSYAIDTFDDQYSNGRQIQERNVAQIPYYDSTACLVEIRQLSLPKSAHAYFKQFQDQTQNTGGLADTPPSAPVGNIRNKNNPQERIVGFFTASAVSAVRYWLDRKDVKGLPFGDTDPAKRVQQTGSAFFMPSICASPFPNRSTLTLTFGLWVALPGP